MISFWPTAIVAAKMAVNAPMIAITVMVAVIGPPWVQFRIGYYVYALLFVVFDIETIFLYPWAVAFGKMGIFVLAEMFVFIGILVAGLAYAWKEGALRWR